MVGGHDILQLVDIKYWYAEAFLNSKSPVSNNFIQIFSVSVSHIYFYTCLSLYFSK